MTSSQATDATSTLTSTSASAAKCLLSLKLRSGPEVIANTTTTQNTAVGKALLLELNKAQVDELLATLEIIQQQIEAST